MLITYRTATGEVVDNTGTNTLRPWGPSDEDGYVNTDAADIPRADLAQLRLNDDDDADLVQQILHRGCRISGGQVVLLEEPPPPSTPQVPDGTVAYGEVADIDPLTVTVDGVDVPAGRLAGYTPQEKHYVKLTRLQGQWVVEDRVLLHGG